MRHAPVKGWQPVLDGELAERADRTVADIVAALEGRTYPSAALASGSAGGAVVYDYLARCGRPGLEAKSEALLDGAIEAVADVTMNHTLYGGFTGVAWAIEHLGANAIEEDGDDDANADTDEALLGYTARSPWIDDYDLVIGLVGFALYALERVARPSARRLLEQIVDRLDETARRVKSGITWRTAPELMIPDTREEYPDGYYNVGLAHGVPGVIAVLARIHEAGIAKARSAELLDGAVRWVVAQRGPEGFPATVGPDGSTAPARTAWCYGDAGVAAALLDAARRAREPSWEAIALDVARVASRRPMDAVGVVDAGICHGAAGLAHLYDRFFQATGDEALRDAARAWYARTLAMRTDGGIAGYRTWGVPFGREEGLEWIDDPSLLGGAAGIAAVLQAGLSSIPPTWDRMLLVDV